MPERVEQQQRGGLTRMVTVSLVAVAVGLALTAGFGAAPTGAALLLGLGVSRLRRGSPEVRARALAAAARDRVPEDEGPVTLVGTVRACAEPIASPFSRRPCVALWARHVGRYGPDPVNSYVVAQYAAATEFVLDCRGTQVTIAASDADLVYDRDHGDIVDADGTLRPMHLDDVFEPRKQELIVSVGDRVVVAGTLVRGNADAGPYRASGVPTLRLEGRRLAPLVLSLLRPTS